MTETNIKTFLKILGALYKIDPDLPLRYAACLAEIALNEGISLTELSERTRLSLSTVSRIVGALSEHRPNGLAYGLVKVNLSKIERRRKELYLTPKGKAVMNGISNILA